MANSHNNSEIDNNLQGFSHPRFYSMSRITQTNGFNSSATTSSSRSHAATISHDFDSVSNIIVDRSGSVELTDEEKQLIQQRAEELLADATRAYELHAYMNRLQVDTKKWKAVKKKDQLAVYKQKKRGNTSSSEISSLETSALVETSLPLMLVIGSYAGKLEDVMFGLSGTTSLAMKFNSSYAQDNVVDADVIATILGPTLDEPFRFLGLKWVAQSLPNSTKKRDMLYFEYMGITTTRTGDIMGYHITQSITSADLSRLNKTVTSSAIRAKTSVCHLFRQRDTGSDIDVFSRGYYDPNGGMMQFLAISVAAEMILHSATRGVDIAHLKKLSWSAQQSGRQRHIANVKRKTSRMGMDFIAEMDAAAEEVDAEANNSSTCPLCDRKFGKIRRRSGAACTICCQVICSRCSLIKKLSFSHSGGLSGNIDFMLSSSESDSSASSARGRSGSIPPEMTKDIFRKSMTFCLPCIVKSNQQSASNIAMGDLLEQINAAQSSSNVFTPMHINSAKNSSTNAAANRRRTRTASNTGSGKVNAVAFNMEGNTGDGAFNNRTSYFRPKAYSTATTAHAAHPNIMLYVEPTSTQ